MHNPKLPNIWTVLLPTVCGLYHIHGNSGSESGADFWLEGGVEFGSVSGVEFRPRGGVESGTAEVWDGASPDNN